MRRWIYRYLYMPSLGWSWTKALRKKQYCNRCGSSRNLHLHHRNYDGYGWWSLLFPDLVSDMETLCDRHHRAEHRKG